MIPWPLRYKIRSRDPFELKLGIELEHVGYTWRAYADRPPDHRADYDALMINLEKAGRLVNPLIAFQDCVIIGMRRLEIARSLKWPRVPVAEITTNITDDPNPDRVFALRDALYTPVDYGGNL